MKLISVALFLSTILLTMPFLVIAEGNAESGKTKSMTCVACHGVNGEGNPSLQAPALSGQHPSYTYKQLHDFKAGRRVNSIMSPMAASLSDQDMQDLSAYFSQLAVQSDGFTDPNSPGGQIYTKGNLKNQVIACVGCHGINGEGNPSLQAPALKSQYSEYIVLQLNAFRSGNRNNDTGKVMRNIAAKMTDEEIEAVARYISVNN